MKMSIAMLSALASFIVVGCTPRIEVAAPEQPITINMNVKIEHEYISKSIKMLKNS